MPVGRKVASALAVATIAIVVWLVGYIAWREHARSSFAGCNLAHREAARTECSSAKMELDYATSDTNKTPAELQVLSQRVARAEADVTKWDAHVRKYGHLCGTGRTAPR